MKEVSWPWPQGTHHTSVTDNCRNVTETTNVDTVLDSSSSASDETTNVDTVLDSSSASDETTNVDTVLYSSSASDKTRNMDTVHQWFTFTRRSFASSNLLWWNATTACSKWSRTNSAASLPDPPYTHMNIHTGNIIVNRATLTTDTDQ